MPILSFIVPCYNSESSVSSTIYSISGCSLDDFECIIVDDGSTDNTVSIISDLISDDDRFILVCLNRNYGVAKARNIALDMSIGKYILPIDSDDTVVADYPLNGVRFLEANDDYSLYYGAVKYVGDGGGKVAPCGYKSYKRMLLFDSITVSGIYRREHAIEVGGYNETLEAMEDYDFWIRYLYHNDKVMLSDEVCIEYTIHSGSRHQSKSSEELDAVLMKIKELNRGIYDEYFRKKKQQN